MLKYENVANIGDTIKAFDFEPMPGREDAYLIGKVIAKGTTEYGYDAYTVEVVKSPGYEKRVGITMYVPFESFMDYEGRVTLFKKAGPSDDEFAAIGKAICEAA